MSSSPFEANGAHGGVLPGRGANMNFSSPLFLFLFLPLVLTVYHLLPGTRARSHWLLLASLVFCAWGKSRSRCC